MRTGRSSIFPEKVFAAAGRMLSRMPSNLAIFGFCLACSAATGKAQEFETAKKTPRWVLRYERGALVEGRERGVEASLTRAADFVEQQFGPFSEPVDVQIVHYLRTPKTGRLLRAGVGGFAGQVDGKAFIMVRVQSASESKFRHELFHAWLRQQGRRPLQALEEGIAELIEGGFNDDMYKVLLRHKGPLSLSKIGPERFRPGLTERHRRATYWLALYHAARLNPALRYADMLEPEFARSLDPDAAWQWLKEQRN